MSDDIPAVMRLRLRRFADARGQVYEQRPDGVRRIRGIVADENGRVCEVEEPRKRKRRRRR